MEQLERLKQILAEDKNTYTLQEIMKVFAMFFDTYEKNSKTCKSIKAKITKGEWNSLVNGITMSFFMSLHASKLSVEEALELADTDGVMGIGIAEVKEDD